MTGGKGEASVGTCVLGGRGGDVRECRVGLKTLTSPNVLGTTFLLSDASDGLHKTQRVSF